MRTNQSQGKRNRSACIGAAALAGLGAFALPGTSNAVTRTWNVADGDWAVPANWTPAAVPTSADLAFVGNAAANSTAHVTTAVPDVFSTFVYNSNILRVETGGNLNVTNNSASALDGLRIGDGFGLT